MRRPFPLLGSVSCASRAYVPMLELTLCPAITVADSLALPFYGML